jgi:hypothetical protein
MKRILATTLLPIASIVALMAGPAVSSSASVQLHKSVASTYTQRVPLYEKGVAPYVKCAKFEGTIDWGGIGGILDPAHLQVHGHLYSYCSSTSYLHLRWNVGFSEHEQLIGKAGPYEDVIISFNIDSRNGEYADIGIQVCSNRYGWSCSDWINV